MAKQKIDKNYLDFIPVKNPEIKYETNDKGNITVFIRWEGFFNKILSTLTITAASSGTLLMIKKTFTHSPRNSMLISLKWKNHSPALLNFSKF